MIKIGDKLQSDKYAIYCKCGEQNAVGIDASDFDLNEEVHEIELTCSGCGSTIEYTVYYEVEVQVNHTHAEIIELPLHASAPLISKDGLYTGLLIDLPDGTHEVPFGSIVVKSGIVETIFNIPDYNQLALELN